jgi:hypothetical protein
VPLRIREALRAHDADDLAELDAVEQVGRPLG